jgi:glycerol kinase
MTKYVGALDQGTTSTRFMIFDHAGLVVAIDQKEHEQIYPKPGWVEHDPMEIWARCQDVIKGALAKAGITAADLAAVGITNQRETAVVWDKRTGKPVYNAIVWQDTRTKDICDALEKDGGPDRLRAKTGLPLATYFSGPKVKWILDNVAGAQAEANAGNLLFGNIDTWCIWNLTGGVNGGVHVTDVTNASRTLMFNYSTLEFDAELTALLGVPASMLPAVKASSEVYGMAVGDLAGVPVAGDLGDQQAALFGQTCFSPGEAKNTYGTGNFMLLNTGTKAVPSKNGLLTTLGYKIGSQPAVYALEGSIAITGALVQWVRDNLGMIEKSADIETLAATVEDNGGVYFVPAFSGLFAPYWKSDARGVIAGLTRYVNKGHIARAVRRCVDGPQGRRWHGLQQPPHAVPVRRPEGPGHPAQGRRDDGARGGLRGRPGRRVLGRGGGPPRELGEGPRVASDDGSREGRRRVRAVEEGRHPHVRLGRLTTLTRCPGAERRP